MQRLQAYKFQLRPTGAQEQQMGRFAGCCRYVWNRALAMQKESHEYGGKHIGYVAIAKHLTAWRHDEETAFLKEAPTHPMQQALLDLERAYKNFFEKRADFPRFKKKGRHDSFRYPDPKQSHLDESNSRIFLPKLGWMRYRKTRVIEGAPKQVTVFGIDVGVKKFAALSEGTIYAPANSFGKHEARLSRVQRALSRKVKFSRNWQKQKRRVAKLHARIANVRRDYLHKTSTAICKNHACVVIEDLTVREMSRSSSGTARKPGRNVKAKSRLNKSILDQSWFEFRRQLEYKQQWLGGMVIPVPPGNTSRTCAACGHVSADNRRNQAKFACVACGHEEDADINAAKNILAAGHAVMACGGMVQSGRPAKQEPTEASAGVSVCDAVGIPRLQAGEDAKP